MLHGVPAKRFFKELFSAASDDDILDGAAALGFFLTLAIFPAMILMMAMIPYLPISNVDQAIMDLLRQALPSDAANMFTNVVQDVTQNQSTGLLSFGAIATLWATSSGMAAIMHQLNNTYDVKEERSFVKARLLAIGLSLLFIVLVIGAFSLIVLGGVMQDWIGAQFGVSGAVLAFFAGLRWVIILAALLLAFALIYYLAPNTEQTFAFITAGSVTGVVLLILASLGFAWYTQNFGAYSATYGSIGAVIVLMLWLYIAGLAILFGSEVNALIERYRAPGKEKVKHASSQNDRRLQDKLDKPRHDQPRRVLN
jgi:membrane protein